MVNIVASMDMSVRTVTWLDEDDIKVLTIIRACTAPEYYHIGPSLPLLKCSPHVMSLHLIIVRDSASIRTSLDLKSINEPVPLFLRQEAASLRAVWDKEDSNHGGDNGQEAFDDKYPL